MLGRLEMKTEMSDLGGSDGQCQSMCCKEDVDVDCILELDHDGPHDDGTGWEW